MAEEQEVMHIELLCKQLYESQDANIREQAEKAIVAFQDSPDTLSKCQALLERSDSSYSQLLAATTLSKLLSKSVELSPRRTAGSLSVQQRIDIRNYVLNYLATRPKLANFVVQALVALFARIAKVGWFDMVKEEYVFRDFMTDITTFLQGPSPLCSIGVQLLSQLVVEMNHVSDADANRSLAKHRKTASSFRDTQLYEIFRLACSLLSAASAKPLEPSSSEQQTLLAALLKLTHNCLTFDFIGTASDEAGDDLCTVQIPTSWRPTFLDGATLELFFSLYHALSAGGGGGGGLAGLALACLVQLASVRRSLFSNNERAKFLQSLAHQLLRILDNTQGLSDPTNYHEFCRLLARLKSNYQLGELVMVENYPRLIEQIAKFTVQSLQMWQFAPNSVHYLLSLWQRMVASVPYVKAAEPHLLETYAPSVTHAYITSRLTEHGAADGLDEECVLQQQLEQLSVIARCEYAGTCRLLVAHFDRAAAAFPDTGPARRAALYGQLTWLVYIIGAAIGGRASVNTCDEHDAMDGELVCRVLQLMELTDSLRQSQGGCDRLELAMLWFFEQFRKIYVGEQVQKNSKVYRRLAEVLGLNDEAQLLSVLMRKIITNLKYWGGSEQIISKTLGLLSDLSGGYTCVRKLVKLDEVQFMLTHHTAEHFPFLGISGVMTSEMRCRTQLYTALGRLLLVELGEDEARFNAFMQPLTAAFESIIGLLGGADEGAMFASEHAQKTLIGLARDLRGLAFAFNTKTAYMMLFDWIYPVYLQVVLRGVSLWYAAPCVTTPCLKLMAELAQNRNQRLFFEVSSPNGILLFRELSKVIVAYGSRILTVEVNKKQLYACKLKGISLCFTILKAALCGNYANFGVFRLYGDDALDNVLNMFVKLLLSISQSDLMDYPKLSQTYYVLLERLAQDHMAFLASLQPEATLYILSSVSEGLTAIAILNGNDALDNVLNMFVKLLLSISQSDLMDYPKLSQTYYVLLERLAQDHMAFLASLQPEATLYILSSVSEGLTAIDTSVCTGCCATLDHIVTYLYKQLVQKTSNKVPLPRQAPPETSAMFVEVLQRRPEIIQQLLSTVLQIVMFEDCCNQWSMSRPLLGLILLNEEHFSRLRAEMIAAQPRDKQPQLAHWFNSLMAGIEPNLLTKNRDRFTQNLSMFRRDITELLKGQGAPPPANDMMTS